MSKDQKDIIALVAYELVLTLDDAVNPFRPTRAELDQAQLQVPYHPRTAGQPNDSDEEDDYKA